jgi:hypothetical protein
MSDSGRIHRHLPPVTPANAQRAGADDARPKFAELLRQRRQAPDTAGADSAVAATLPGLPGPIEPVPAAEGIAPRAQKSARAARSQFEANQPPQEPPPVREAGAKAAVAAQGAQMSPAERQCIATLARTVSHFCNDRAVSDSEGWQVRIPLRPEVLPETTLSLSISPHWLSLRFDIGDADARGLVSRHSDELARMLETALVRTREISITFD